MHCHFKFEMSARCVVVGDKENDWNKLGGFSLGFLPKKINGKWKPAHQYSSIRIGWRNNYVYGKLELCLYGYDKGKRYTKGSIFIEPEKSYNAFIWMEGHVAALVVLEEGKEYPVGVVVHEMSDTGKVGYRLGGYFGGNLPAPQTIRYLYEPSSI